MVQACCVLGCPSGTNLPSHCFPSNPEQLEKWKNVIPFRMDISSLKDFKKLRICYLHFAEDNYKLGYAQRKLKDKIVPSLNLNVTYSEEDTNASVRDVALNVHTEHDKIKDVHEERNDEAGPSIGSTPKHKRLRLLQNQESKIDLTPKAARLYNIAGQIRKKQLNASKTLIGFKKRLRQAEKFSKDAVFSKLMSLLSKPQQLFLSMQFRNSKCKPQGRRFTEKEKVLALSLYKQSGRCYRLLENIFHLPCARSLRLMLNKISINTGCNEFICRQLQEKGKTMSNIDKVCCLMFDEMAIQPHVEYDAQSDYIVGFEDYHQIRTPKYADHALVFMVRGIHTGWKFPIAYFFTENQATTTYLIQCITKIIQSILDCGFLPVALVCDQGKTNVAAINKLKADTSINMQDKVKYSNTIYLCGVEICTLYDPPHLLKGIRNNLLTKDLEIDFKNQLNEERRFARWEIIELAYKIDIHSNSIYRLMPKLTDEHIIKNKIKKMRVKHAAQVLSRSVAGFIDHHTLFDGGIQTQIGYLRMPVKEGHDTAEAVLFFDTLFDSVNGHLLKAETDLRTLVNRKSKHSEFWVNAIDKLSEMRFVNTNNQCPTNNSPVIKHWKTTIEGFQTLWEILQQLGFKYFKPRYLNQDPLENFFGCIRSLNFRYTNPTPQHFKSNFKTLLLNNLATKNTFGNCETICDGQLLFPLQTSHNDSALITEHFSIENIISERSEAHTFPFLDQKKISFHNITRKIFKHASVQLCADCYSLLHNESVQKNFTESYKLILKHLPNMCYTYNIKMQLQTMLLININYNLNCKDHGDILTDLFLNELITTCISAWCHFINNILNRKMIIKHSHPIYKEAIKKSERNVICSRRTM